jgi:two-component system chemotaxis response regulator CheB
MDVAMPEMDGISAVREIMRAHPTDIIMFSALTSEGAYATLDALEAGAVDFMPKQNGIDGRSGQVPADGLCRRVVSIARRKRGIRVPQAGSSSTSMALAPVGPRRARRSGPAPRLVVIGASTGGPVAIQRVLTRLPADYPVPVLVAVHMPAEFTSTFAERLDAISPIKVRHAHDGDELLPGQALIAPGGMQTLVEAQPTGLRVRVMQGGDQLYKPSVDILFGSAARALNEGVQAVVLTGMGADGTEGARLLKERGASVWSQDQATCAVYGMPYSVAKAGHTDRVLALDEIGAALTGLV